MDKNTKLLFEINEKMYEERSISNEVTLMSTEIFYRIMGKIQPYSISTEMIIRKDTPKVKKETNQ